VTHVNEWTGGCVLLLTEHRKRRPLIENHSAIDIKDDGAYERQAVSQSIISRAVIIDLTMTLA
jgi:hypothetical protein